MRTNLQQIRKAAGFKSAKDFADFADININTYTNYEQGRRNIDIEMLCYIADKLNCSIDALIGRAMPEGPTPQIAQSRKPSSYPPSKPPELSCIDDWIALCSQSADDLIADKRSFYKQS